MKSSYLVRAIQFVWQRGKWWMIASVTLSIVNGCFPFLTLWISKELIDEVTRFIQSDTWEYVALVWLLIGQFSITVLSSLSKNIKEYLDKQMVYKVEFDVQHMILANTSSVPVMYFDLAEYHNHLQRISGGGSRFLSPVRTMIDMFEAALSLCSYAAFLIVIHWSLLLVSLLATIPIFLVQAKYSQLRYRLHVKQNPVAREAEYYKYLLQDRTSAKEIRLFGLASFFLNRWIEKFVQNASETLRLERRQQGAEVGMEAVSSFFYMGMAVALIWLARTTKMSIGDFIAIIQAIQGTQGTLNRISTLLAKLYEEKLYIKDFYQFFEINEPRIEINKGQEPFPTPIQRGITFENVSFRYIHGDRDVLSNVSFHINPQEKIAIIGQNGSGKTTLIKCLMGLYPPLHGQIKIDGKNIYDIDQKQLLSNITVIFQDFIRYHLTVRENIAVGDIKRMDDWERIQAVAKVSGTDSFIQQFALGYETPLGRLLVDGEDLSGGQWQKIALARALFRDSQVVILDEPTASLDPIAEMEIFQNFKLLADKKIAIFISHRMAASRMADRIIVMKEGKIVEMGTHEELMELRQEYYHMYTMQAQWFSAESEYTKEVVGWRN
ncbi:MAG: ABC transporter ATP-binding protein [Brevibacillus sp.]|nr:ABC transporter ATP-binding protein [Brevibacillus sp. MCWH]REK66968.1 MAG: ABC transporter ATP-binding protein [Brevibacillus sp.]